MKNQILLIVSFLLLTFSANAQVAINTSGDTASASAALDISSNTKGLLIPRMTAIERVAITAPATGLMVFDNDSNAFWFYNGVSWQPIALQTSSSTDTLNLITDADNDTKIQVEETADEDVIRFDLAGTEQFKMTGKRFETINSGRSVIIGEGAGLNDNASIKENTFIGFEAASTNTSGAQNVAIGNLALEDNSTGSGNTALGSQALNNNTTGTSNTALGYKANVTTGNLTNATAIGYQSRVAASNSLVLGGLAPYNVNVGIGTSSPTELLTLSGNSGTDGILFPDNTLQTTAYTGSTAVSELTDADNDTKIQVEETADEDIIRFDVGGTEYFNMNNGRLEVLNTGNSVFIGENAGINDDLTNNRNTLIGSQAGKNFTTGANNVAVGYNAGSVNDIGKSNIYIGGYAGVNNMGSGNLMIGRQSGFNNPSGGNNTFLGFNAGGNSTGSGSVFIGYNAGYHESGSDKLYIENSISSFPLIYGEFDNDLLRINGTLDINNAYSFPTADGTANQILQTDGAGNATWQTVTTTTPDAIADADNNTKIQVEESADEDIIRFDMAGIEYFRMDSGRLEVLNTGNSVFIGQNAGLNDDFSGNKNVAIGNNALKMNQTGLCNTAIGNSALPNNTSTFNTAIGQGSGLNNQGGTSNVLVGWNAGKGAALHSGSYNVMVGRDAGLKNQGSYNVIMGKDAGYENLTGTGNVFLGSFSGFNELGSNKLYIDNTNSSSPLIYGEFNNNLLRVNGTLNINNAFSLPTTDGTANQVLETDGSGNVTWVSTADTDDQTLSFSGNNLFIEDGNSVDLSTVAVVNTTVTNSETTGQNASIDIKGQLEVSGEVQTYGNVKLGGAGDPTPPTITIGSSGTALTSIIKSTVSKNLPNIGSGTSFVTTFSVTNAAVGGSVFISPANALTNGLVISYARVSSAGTVEVKFRNVRNSGINEGNMDWYISIIQ